MASSHSQLALQSDIESPLSSLLSDLSHQVQGVMENMLKMTNEIDQHSAGIIEEIERCKDTACERKKALDEENYRFQKAAYTALDLLSNRQISC